MDDFVNHSIFTFIKRSDLKLALASAAQPHCVLSTNQCRTLRPVTAVNPAASVTFCKYSSTQLLASRYQTLCVCVCSSSATESHCLTSSSKLVLKSRNNLSVCAIEHDAQQPHMPRPKKSNPQLGDGQHIFRRR